MHSCLLGSSKKESNEETRGALRLWPGVTSTERWSSTQLEGLINNHPQADRLMLWFHLLAVRTKTECLKWSVLHLTRSKRNVRELFYMWLWIPLAIAHQKGFALIRQRGLCLIGNLEGGTASFTLESERQQDILRRGMLSAPQHRCRVPFHNTSCICTMSYLGIMLATAKKQTNFQTNYCTPGAFLLTAYTQKGTEFIFASVVLACATDSPRCCTMVWTVMIHCHGYKLVGYLVGALSPVKHIWICKG